MSNKINVLDHGYVILRNISGPTRRSDAEFDADDVDPANVARKSFDQLDSNRPRDMELRLNDYLMRNWHTTPIEMIEIWLEMKMPIVAARQLVRHRTAAIDEVSARYVQLPAEWYIPKLEDVVIQTKDKKQGGRLIDLNNPVEVGQAQWFIEELNKQCGDSYKKYNIAIKYGMAMEQARLFLHVNHYTHWVWKQDLHNMMSLLARRDHSHAQRESQHYAQAIDTLLRKQVPNLMSLYDKYRRFDN
jgi:thymidylate synthase, flavin-dependent